VVGQLFVRSRMMMGSSVCKLPRFGKLDAFKLLDLSTVGTGCSLTMQPGLTTNVVKLSTAYTNSAA